MGRMVTCPRCRHRFLVKKSKQNYMPTDDEKKIAPVMFRYELTTFWHALDIHINLSGEYATIGKAVHNETLESLLIHTRNLFDFFYGPEIPNDDIRAFHFIEKSVLWRPSKSEYLEEIKPSINKHLTHLTYSRIQGKEWDWKKIALEINEAYKEFLEALPYEEVGNWKIDGLLHLLTEIKSH